MDNVTALAVPQQPKPRALEFSAEQRKMIRDTFANGASDSEFAVLMEVSRARGLNPLLRQIHFVQRWDSNKGCKVWSTQISIDGLRAVAERTGIYAGQDEPVFEHDKDGKPTVCRVRVYRKDWGDRAAVGVAHFNEYAQTKKDGSYTTFWATKPHIMLAKCAEALAIRKAFPEDTSGLYVAEEMGEEPTPHANVAAAARVLEGEVVQPQVEPEPPPQEAPKATPGPPPPYVMALWNRLVKQERGNKKLAKAAWDKAAEKCDVPLSTVEWTKEHAAQVQVQLWPEDVA